MSAAFNVADNDWLNDFYVFVISHMWVAIYLKHVFLDGCPKLKEVKD